jgi:hypothetical protein
MIPASPILIDAGRSSIGWSFWSSFFLCLHKGYRTYVNPELDRPKKMKKQRGPTPKGPGKVSDRRVDAVVGSDKRDVLPPSPAMTQGSMGHIALAHHYARYACRKGDGFFYEGETYNDDDAFYTPKDALQTWVMVNNRGGTYVEVMEKTYDAYRKKDFGFSDRVVGIEIPIKLILGYNDKGVFGLWLDQPWHRSGVTPRSSLIQAPLPLDAPGLERGDRRSNGLHHGGPIPITKRFDMVVQAADGRYYIWDHKVTGGRITGDKAKQYVMDGQFAVNNIAGKLLFGRQFGGVILNFVMRRPPFINRKQMVPDTKLRDAMFPLQLRTVAHQVGGLLASNAGPEEWTMAQSELVCWHKYGRCQVWELCTSS